MYAKNYTPSATFFVADSMGLAPTNFTQLAPKAAALCKIVQCDGHWAIKGYRFWDQ